MIKNWDQFQPIFRDKKRTEVFFGVVEDVRNCIAHGRDLVPFERDLISGVAGMIRNLVSIYRNNRDQATRYYPLIERLVDGFGVDVKSPPLAAARNLGRVNIGDSVSFDGTAFSSKGKSVKWELLRCRAHSSLADDALILDEAFGDSVTLHYTFTEGDVGEGRGYVIRIIADSSYHRHSPQSTTPFDDSVWFVYSINPPDE